MPLNRREALVVGGVAILATCSDLVPSVAADAPDSGKTLELKSIVHKVAMSDQCSNPTFASMTYRVEGESEWKTISGTDGCMSADGMTLRNLPDGVSVSFDRNDIWRIKSGGEVIDPGGALDGFHLANNETVADWSQYSREKYEELDKNCDRRYQKWLAEGNTPAQREDLIDTTEG